MIGTIDSKFLKDFYKDEKSIETVEQMCEIWDKREPLLGGLIRQSVWDKLEKNMGYYQKKEKDPTCLFKDINDTLSIYFYSNPEDNYLYLGFWYEKKITGNKEIELEKMLNNILRSPYFEGKYKEDEDHSFTKWFCPGEYKEPLPEIEAYFLARCKALEEAAAEINNPAASSGVCCSQKEISFGV